MKVEGGKFVLDTGIKPTDGIYNCDKGNVAKLTGDYGNRRQVPEPGLRHRPEAVELFMIAPKGR